nr:right-handed parallel beta-helix repeat-containing protein [Microbacterium esteraromaticum]
MAAPPAHVTGLPVLRPGDDWQLTLTATPHIQLVAGAVYALTATIDLPDGAFIEGNGAIITVADEGIGALRAQGRRNISIRNVIFRGRDGDPLGSEPRFEHVAIRLTRCSGYRITDCDFENWRGCGIAVTGSTGDDYFEYRGQVSGNTFHHCYLGVSFADRAEYSLLAQNIFTRNRLAVWNSSGNLTMSGNVVVSCYGAYYSFAQTSPYGVQASDNWAHGSVTGNTFNHSNGGGGPLWKTNAAFPIGGSTVDPGPGIAINRVIPPTFSANTLWYTDVTCTQHGANIWNLTGCASSDLTVSAAGAEVRLVGCQWNRGHDPKLVGSASIAAL